LASFGEGASSVLEAGTDLIHLGIMDNHYVPNLTFGPSASEALKSATGGFMDVHLMVGPVDGLVGSFADAGADQITFHPEATRHAVRAVQSSFRQMNGRSTRTLMFASGSSVAAEVLP